LVLNAQNIAWTASKTFTLVNNSGKNITAVYCIPMNAKNFGKNLLPYSQLYNNSSCKISVENQKNNTRYILCLFLDGSGLRQWTNVDIFKISKIAIKPKIGKKGAYTAIYESEL